MNQDVVAVQLLPQNQWVAPSSVVLQDEGEAKDDNTEEEKEERAVNLGFGFELDLALLLLKVGGSCMLFPLS